MRRITVLIALFVVLFSVGSVEGKKQQSNMNKNIYAAMVKLQKILPTDPKTVIIARHGMEFWSMWIFRIDAVRQEGLTRNYWSWYNNVLFLRQKKETAQFGPAGLYGPPYPQPTLPAGSYRVYSNDYFDLYKSPVPPSDMSIFQPKR
jgi:hypothetical protein